MTQDVLCDLSMLQGRNEESPAPELGEGQRFPERNTINDFLAVKSFVSPRPEHSPGTRI